jgi:hypothetical protein
MSVDLAVDLERPDRLISRVCLEDQISIGFIDVVEPNENLGVFDELAVFGEPEGKTVLPHDQFGSCYKRLENFIGRFRRHAETGTEQDYANSRLNHKHS